MSLRTHGVLWLCAGALVAGCRFEPSGPGFVPDENEDMDIDARAPDGGGAVPDGGSAVVDAATPTPDGPPSGVPGCPEDVGRQWRASFDEDPTQLDLNGDDIPDWTLRGMPDSPLPAGSMAGGRWLAQPFEELDTLPVDDFDTLTTAEVRMRDGEDNSDDLGAVFWINADWSDGTFIPLFVSLRLSGGTQTLTLNANTTGGRQPLIEIENLPDGLVSVGLRIDPDDDTVALWVDGQSRGSADYNKIPQDGKTDRFATVLGYDSQAEFDFVRVSVCSDN